MSMFHTYTYTHRYIYQQDKTRTPVDADADTRQTINGDRGGVSMHVCILRCLYWNLCVSVIGEGVMHGFVVSLHLVIGYRGFMWTTANINGVLRVQCMYLGVFVVILTVSWI